MTEENVEKNKTMEVLSYNKFGRPEEILEYTEAPIPNPTSTEVLVKVKAMSVNPIDWKLMRGDVPSISKSFPVTPGFDISGTVIEIGSSCERIKVGDEVYGMARGEGSRICGSCAPYMCISERCVDIRPSNINDNEAASFPMVGLTTIQSLNKYLKDGKKILILGGSGGVGTFAIQYAKVKGCYVAATCGERNMQLLQELGADRVINYQQENWWEVLEGEDYDILFDLIGGYDTWKNSTKVLKKKSTFCTLKGDSDLNSSFGKIAYFTASYIHRNFWSLIRQYPQYVYTLCDSTKASTQLADLRQLIEGGLIRPVIDSNGLFEFKSAIDAFKYSAEGHATGKIIVNIIPEDAFDGNHVDKREYSSEEENIVDRTSYVNM
jgi:NADPH:quinone reductase-like Zn-dependent oxidoreductase